MPTSREELLRMVRKLREHTGIDLDERGYNARWICLVCQQQSSANGGALPDITHAPDCAWYTPVD